MFKVLKELLLKLSEAHKELLKTLITYSKPMKPNSLIEGFKDTKLEREVKLALWELIDQEYIYVDVDWKLYPSEIAKKAMGDLLPFC